MAVRMSRAERREQTRQELLTAAEACFVTRGFHATSVDQVAERAGYTKGAVYSNFTAKEDLFFAVYERRVEQVLTEVAPGLRQGGLEHAFDSLATATIDRRDRDDGWLAVFFEFWGHVVRHPELRERFAAIHARFLEPLADAVQQLGRGPRPDPARRRDGRPGGPGLERDGDRAGPGAADQPQAVDVAAARRMGWLLLDAALDGARPAADNKDTQQDRSIR